MRLRRAFWLAGVLLALAPSSVIPIELPSESDTWIRAQTPGFTIYSNASERRTREIGRQLEKFREVLSKVYRKLATVSPVATTVYLFKDDASFLPYKFRFEGKPANIAGYFSARWDENSIAMNASAKVEPLHVIYHEYMHYCLRSNLPPLPPWFEEGLAECYGTFRSDEKTAEIGQPDENHLVWLNNHGLMPLTDLFAVNHLSRDYYEGEKQGDFYAESWALVHYLLWDKPERRAQIVQFLDRLGGGEEPPAAFIASFETTSQQLEVELRRYIHQVRFHFTLVKFNEREAVDVTTRVQPIARDEALSHLGDLLLHESDDRGADAEALFREALRLNPASAPAHAGLGLAEAEAGRWDEAVPHFEKAVSLVPDDYLTNFHYGECLLHRGEATSTQDAAALTRARALLGRSIDERPGFAEAYASLGKSYINEAGDREAGIARLEAARKLLPARPDVASALAILYGRRGEFSKARDVVKDAQGRVDEPRALDGAKSFLSTMESMQTQWKGAGAGPSSLPAFFIGPSSANEDLPGPPQLPVTVYNAQVDLYNKAVALANQGDYKQAIALLERLLKDIQDPELSLKTRSLLETFKKDAARLHKL